MDRRGTFVCEISVEKYKDHIGKIYKNLPRHVKIDITRVRGPKGQRIRLFCRFPTIAAKAIKKAMGKTEKK